MTPEIRYFQQLMNSNRMAAYYTGQAISGLNADLKQALTGILRTQLLRYMQLPVMRKQIDSSDDFNVQLKAVLDFFPSFLFVIISELNVLQGSKLPTRRLMLAGIFYVSDRTFNHQSHVQLFVDGLQQKQALVLSEESNPDPESMVLPEVVFQDFQILARQPVRFQATKSTTELIENQFCFLGLSQIFLKYFFDLFAASKDDRFSQQINVVFSRLFIALRLEEIRYWKGFNNSTMVKKRITDIIQANSRSHRHPKLQKDTFAALANTNPIIHNGTSRGMTATTQSVLKAQLAEFHAFSVVQTTLLMNIVHRFKGDDFAVYLISQMIKADKDRLKQLDTYLGRLQQKSLQTLHKLISSFIRRFFPEDPSTAPVPKNSGGIQYSDESARLAVAKKKIKTLKDRKGMMTHDMVARYLEERLRKLYEKVKKSGALTADMIPQYLAKFAEAAEKVLVEVNPARQKELIEAFEESTDDILSEITRFSEMSEDEIEEIRSDIHEKVGALDTPDLDKRTEVVEQIGMTLSDISEKEDPPTSPPPEKKIDVAALLANEQVTIGFDEKSPAVPLSEFFKLPFGERKGPPEDDWFVHHRRYLELAAENKRLNPIVLEALPEIEQQVPKLKYRKYFNIFPNGEYEDPTCSAVYDIWKSSALERLRVE